MYDSAAAVKRNAEAGDLARGVKAALDGLDGGGFNGMEGKKRKRGMMGYKDTIDPSYGHTPYQDFRPSSFSNYCHT